MSAARAALAPCAAALALACAAVGSRPAGAPAPLVQRTEGRPAMGTVLEITVVAHGDAAAQRALDDCFAESARLEALFTTWRADGELARLDALAGHGPQPASPELVRILRDAQRLTRETGGTFDPSVGPIVALWREAERRGRPPESGEIAAARRAVGPRDYAVDAGRARVTLAPGAALDLGGFAKGWTLDRLGERLARAGISRALLDFGGSSLLALGSPLDADAWRVAVERGPVLALRDRSVSISAAFGQSFEIAGERYAHIVDPRSGAPVSRARRAIVVATNGATAEAWSKAYVVRPMTRARALVPQKGVLAVSVDDGGAPVRSARFAELVSAEPAP